MSRFRGGGGIISHLEIGGGGGGRDKTSGNTGYTVSTTLGAAVIA